MKFLVFIPIILLFSSCESGSNHNSAEAHSPENQDQSEHEKLILENEKVIVKEYYSTPKGDVCGFGKHSHPEHLTIMLTDATISVTDENGNIKIANLKMGDSFWSPPETHITVSTVEKKVRLKIIELKK